MGEIGFFTRVMNPASNLAFSASSKSRFCRLSASGKWPAAAIARARVSPCAGLRSFSNTAVAICSARSPLRTLASGALASSRASRWVSSRFFERAVTSTRRSRAALHWPDQISTMARAKWVCSSCGRALRYRSYSSERRRIAAGERQGAGPARDAARACCRSAAPGGSWPPPRRPCRPATRCGRGRPAAAGGPRGSLSCSQRLLDARRARLGLAQLGEQQRAGDDELRHLGLGAVELLEKRLRRLGVAALHLQGGQPVFDLEIVGLARGQPQVERQRAFGVAAAGEDGRQGPQAAHVRRILLERVAVVGDRAFGVARRLVQQAEPEIRLGTLRRRGAGRPCHPLEILAGGGRLALAAVDPAAHQQGFEVGRLAAQQLGDRRHRLGQLLEPEIGVGQHQAGSRPGRARCAAPAGDAPPPPAACRCRAACGPAAGGRGRGAGRARAPS